MIKANSAVGSEAASDSKDVVSSGSEETGSKIEVQNEYQFTEVVSRMQHTRDRGKASARSNLMYIDIFCWNVRRFNKHSHRSGFKKFLFGNKPIFGDLILRVGKNMVFLASFSQGKHHFKVFANVDM